jgi:predicted transcriptional regulator
MAGKCKENPRYNVLSVRVSDEERESLERLSRESNKKVSELMREALQIMVPLPVSV